jgi:hypothetical protein
MQTKQLKLLKWFRIFEKHRKILKLNVTENQKIRVALPNRVRSVWTLKDKYMKNCTTS